jgi:hypothetical protein
VLDLFRPEGLFLDPVGTTPSRLSSHPRLPDHLERSLHPPDFSLEAVIPTTDRHIAVAWTVEADKGRPDYSHPGIGAFEAVNGGLRSVEEYWRLSDLLGQL